MSKKVKLIVVVMTSVFLLGALSALAYFQIKETKNQTMDAAFAVQAKLDEQQQKIDELQSYRDEQISAVEEEKRVTEQQKQEEAEASKLVAAQRTKQDCEDTKRYCFEEIKNRKASIDDIKNQIKENERTVETQEKNCKDAKADEEMNEQMKRLACSKTLAETSLKEMKENLANQEKELTDLLKGKCLNYQTSC